MLGDVGIGYGNINQRTSQRTTLRASNHPLQIILRVMLVPSRSSQSPPVLIFSTVGRLMKAGLSEMEVRRPAACQNLGSFWSFHVMSSRNHECEEATENNGKSRSSGPRIGVVFTDVYSNVYSRYQ